MIYAALVDMTVRFGDAEMIQISDKDNHLNAINIPRVDAALVDASAEIDQHLGSCYLLPLTVTGPFLRHLCCDIARYHLYDSIRLGSSNNFEDHESARRYKDAIEHLKTICKTNLVDDIGQIIPRKNNQGISVASRSSCLPKDSCCGC